MPSQPVIEKLEKLQTELETISVAVKHIDEAAKVAKTASDILNKIPELLAELKSVEEKHRKDLQKDLKEKIDAIEKQLQSLLVELKDKTKQLSQVIDETKKLEKSITDYFAELRKINFQEKFENLEEQINTVISHINIVNDNLIEIQNQVIESLNIVKSGIDKLGLSTIKQIISLEKQVSKNAETFVAGIQNLTDQNISLNKEVKTNRIIQAIGFGLTLIILIYLIFK